MAQQTIEESLYRWQKQGWSVEKADNGQFTLSHPKARTIVVGARTHFQDVGHVQGEMQRALRDGPPPKVQYPEPAPNGNEMAPRRVKKKKPPRHPGANHFALDEPRPATAGPPSAYRRARNVIVAEPPASPRRPLPFENAAWELAFLNLTVRHAEEGVINIMRRRYETDAAFRDDLIARFRTTSQAEIESLRRQVARKAGN